MTLTPYAWGVPAGAPRSLFVASQQDNDNQDDDQYNQDADQGCTMRMVVIKAAKSFDEHEWRTGNGI